MAVRKKTEEQQEVVQDVACASKEKEQQAEVVLNYDEWYTHHANVLTERLDNGKDKLKKLDEAMLDKALYLLDVAGDGCGELRIKQIETAIEIYKTVQIL